LRKIVLSLIITMSLAITSGAGASISAQQRLEQTLEQAHAAGSQSQITLWYQEENSADKDGTEPVGLSGIRHIESRKTSFQGKTYVIKDYQLNGITGAVEFYIKNRDAAKKKGGGASLKISAMLPASYPADKATGESLLRQLGGEDPVQEIQEGSLFSVASLAQGWGPPIFAGNDELNLQIVMKPDSESGQTRLYITAPVIIGDL